MAFGRLRIRPYDFYCMTWREYSNACAGYYDEQEMHQHYLRRVAYIVHCSMVEKPASIQKIWPIGEEVEEPGKISDSLLKKLALFKQQQALKEQDERTGVETGS